MSTMTSSWYLSIPPQVQPYAASRASMPCRLVCGGTAFAHSWSLTILVSKYATPPRLWRHGIHSFLELYSRHDQIRYAGSDVEARNSQFPGALPPSSATFAPWAKLLFISRVRRITCGSGASAPRPTLRQACHGLSLVPARSSVSSTTRCPTSYLIHSIVYVGVRLG